MLGTAASWTLARGLEGLLFEVTATDPRTFAGMLLVLATVALIAGYLPARRAAQIDPMNGAPCGVTNEEGRRPPERLTDPTMR